MTRTILKGIIGVGIWLVLALHLKDLVNGNRELLSLLILIWSLGTVFGFLHHMRVILRMLDPSLKLSVISFLTFRSGILGSFPLILYLVYIPVLGWLHGIALMVREIAGLRSSD